MNKFQFRYSLSKTEMLLLVLLAMVAITALAYHTLFLPEWTAFQAKKLTFQQEKIQAQTLKSEFEKIDAYIEEDAKLTDGLSSLRQILPPYLSEEEILTSIDAHASSSGLEVLRISFGSMMEHTQPAFFADLLLRGSSEEGSADSSSQNTDSSATETETTSIRSNWIDISFKGSYDALISFLSAFETGTRQVYFRSLTTSREENGILNGVVTMLVFSSQDEKASLDKPDFPGYDYETPASLGKVNPFAAFSHFQGGTQTRYTSVTIPDFYLILNTYNDNANKILIGKYPISATQIGWDENKSVSASLSLSTAGTNCAYTYTVGNESYSGSFPLKNPQSQLSVSILSHIRKSSLDNVGITLDVQNNTGLPITIHVKNDDPNHPRFQLGSTEGSVQVVQ